MRKRQSSSNFVRLRGLPSDTLSESMSNPKRSIVRESIGGLFVRESKTESSSSRAPKHAGSCAKTVA